VIWFVIGATAGFVTGALTTAVGLLLLASAWASSATRQLDDKPDSALTNEPQPGARSAAQYNPGPDCCADDASAVRQALTGSQPAHLEDAVTPQH